MCFIARDKDHEPRNLSAILIAKSYPLKSLSSFFLIKLVQNTDNTLFLFPEAYPCWISWSITHNVAVTLDKPPFYLKIVEEMCNYRNVFSKD